MVMDQELAGLELVIGHQTSAHWTLAMCPFCARSIQLASYNLGPIRKFKSEILSSSLTKVAVNPNLACAAIVVTTLLNIAAGTTWTSSNRMNPHSLEVRKSITFCESCDLFLVLATMEYVLTTKPDSLWNISLLSEVNTAIFSGWMVHHCKNCCLHCITDTEDVQSTMTDFLMVQAAVIPTRVLPAPQGNTMIPDLARPLPNILESDFSWYGLICVEGFKSIGKSGFLVSFLKSYSSKTG
ncbi:hypothetical protein WICPIJ_000444 [Wickerhamomyces pijperi]|uniref:Uncharacterized protein n=1 Tax=Wickerhamomyces pijperi TaxID=599730 RepID=A0A9P8TQU4_WICPI|nr:hypothetical protein WICPIJ_000444 [Wickerhamomyces pijperi]